MAKTMLSANFAAEEFACPCCDYNNVQSELVGALQELRDRLRTPVVIVSGCRCPRRNKAVGGALNSRHLHGLAADIMVASTPTLHVLMVAELVKRFTGFGYREKTLHLDVDADRAARAYWRYEAARTVAIDRNTWAEYNDYAKAGELVG